MIRYLVDVSAWARYPDPVAGARLDELCAGGVVATCGTVELHLLGMLRDPATYAAVAALRRHSVPILDTIDADFQRALDVQARLVAAVPWPTILVAAVAQRHGVVVLHADPRFDTVAAVAGVGVVALT